MSKKKLTFEYCDKMVQDFEEVIEKPILNGSSVYYTGVDLGTACVVLAVLDENYKPVAGAYRYADVVRDGMVVDYIGAIRIVRELKQEIEEKLNTELLYAAAAIPPGTDALDSGAIKNVVQSAGFELTNLLDEPTAANAVLKIENGAVVDIGGGTTNQHIKNHDVNEISLVGGTCCLTGIEEIIQKQTGVYTHKPKNPMFVTPLGIALSCTQDIME